MNNAQSKPFIIVIFAIVFGIYNILIYTSEGKEHTVTLSEKGLKGQQLWQRHNCWSCHQIYGLGGYLGPDLTNVFSAPNKGEAYIKAIVNAGVKAMPKFNFSTEEKDALVDFLRQVDRTGYYPNKDAVIKANGWVAIKYKT
jgi:nitric oxide reductase subunit C